MRTQFLIGVASAAIAFATSAQPAAAVEDAECLAPGSNSDEASNTALEPCDETLSPDAAVADISRSIPGGQLALSHVQQLATRRSDIDGAADEAPQGVGAACEESAGLECGSGSSTLSGASTALGRQTVADINATAVGFSADATGINSLAIGSTSLASGDQSICLLYTSPSPRD